LTKCILHFVLRAAFGCPILLLAKLSRGRGADIPDSGA